MHDKTKCKLVAIINMKGGVGKTTLSANLAMELAGRGNKVLLVDLDPQANATLVFMSDDEFKQHIKLKQKTITNLFINLFEPRVPLRSITANSVEISEYIFSVPLMGDVTDGGLLDFIPSDIYLSSVLRGINLGPYSLDKLIDEKAKSNYDYVLIDCAPTYSSLTTVALNTAKCVLIPLIADSFGKHGTDLMQQILKEHKHDFGVEVRVVGVVFTMYDSSKATQRDTNREIVIKWGSDEVFRSTIRYNEWYRISNGQRRSFTSSQAHLGPKSELLAFVDEFQTRI